MNKILITIIILIVFTGSVSAKYTQTCKVKYKKEFGWSNYYTVDVSFMSGHELNSATKTLNYQSYSTYAIIFWDKDEASVIKISSLTGCGIVVTKNCISNAVTNLKGKDQQGRSWEVCAKNYCF